MANRSKAIGLLAALGVLVLGAAALLLWKGGNEPGGSGDDAAASADGRRTGDSGAAVASSAPGAAATDNKVGEALRAAASTVDESVLALVGETVVVRGRVVVRETGAPPKNAIVGVRTGRDELDNAWMISRVGGRAKYGRLTLTGELELEILEAGGQRLTFQTPARPDGTFELRVPKKAVRFCFEVVADFAACLDPEWYFLTPETLAKPITVTLSESGMLEGKLVNEAGQPLPGGWVVAEGARVWNPYRPYTPGTQFTTTDKEGRFSIRGLPPGKPSLSACAEGFAAKNDNSATIEPGKTTTIELKLQPEVPLEGLAVDTQGKPVEGITVRLMAERHWFRGIAFGIAKSDAQGRLRWRNLVPSTYRANSYPEGRHFVEAPTTIKAPLPPDGTAPKWVLEPGHFLAGKVVNSEGKPVAGAKLYASPGAEEGAPNPNKRRMGDQRAISAADGTFKMVGLPEGPLSLDAVLEDVSRARKTNIAHDAADVEIQLPGATGIAGTVVDSVTGAPIPCFVISYVRQVELERMGGRYWGWGGDRQKAQLSETGAFEIGGLEPETYAVRATAEGYSETDLREVVVKTGEMTRGLVIRLTPGAVVAGRVIEADTGKPIPGAEVELLDPDENDNGIRMPGEKVQPDGKFEMRGRKPGRGRLVASHDKYVEAASESFELQPGGRYEAPPIALTRGGAAEGIALTREGAPLAGGEVQAYYSDSFAATNRPRHAWRNVTSEKDGSFRMEGLQPGQWTFSAMPKVVDDNWQQAQNRQLQTRATIVDGQTATVVFTIPKQGGCTLRGRVTRGGKPVANGYVYVYRQSPASDDPAEINNQNLQAQLGADGEYEIEHVPPGKVYFNFNSWGESSSSYGAEIEIPAAAEHTYNVDLPRGGEIKGRVTRKSDGKPLPGMSVNAYSTSGDSSNASTQSNAVTGSDGRYTLSGLRAGSVTVQVEPMRWNIDSKSDLARMMTRSQSTTVTDGGSTSLDFVVDEGATAIIEVVDPDGKPAPGIWINVNPVEPKAGEQGGYGNTNDTGIAKIQGLAPVKMRAYAQALTYPPASSEDFLPVIGSETRVQIRLQRGVEVTIRLLGPDGAVVPIESITLSRPDGSMGGNAYSGNVGQPKDGAIKLWAVPGSYKAHFWLAAGKGSTAVDVTIGDQSGVSLDVKADKITPNK